MMKQMTIKKEGERDRIGGVQGSHTDFLLCAVSYRNNMPLFTTDNDFKHYSENIDISLYTPRKKCIKGDQ